MNVPGFENTVAPPNAPSNIRMGVSTNRGPISIRVVCGGPLGWAGSFSSIYNVILSLSNTFPEILSV